MKLVLHFRGVMIVNRAVNTSYLGRWRLTSMWQTPDRPALVRPRQVRRRLLLELQHDLGIGTHATVPSINQASFRRLLLTLLLPHFAFAC